MKWMLAILATLLVGSQIKVVGQDPIFTAINLEKEIPGIQVNKLLQDDNGFILLGTNRGLYRFDGQLIIPVPQRPGLEVDISSIFLSQDSIIWVGCSNGTICRVMGDSLVNVEFDGETPGVAITAITETRDNITWFGTYGEGIYYWNGKSLLNINADDGLPDNAFWR